MKKMLLLCSVTVFMSQAGAVLVDNFESYQAGLIRDGVTGGVWKEITAGTSFAVIGEDAGNKFLQTGWSGGGRGAYRCIDPIVDSVSAITLYLRIYAVTSSQDTSFGLADQITTSAATWGDFEVQMVLGNGDDADHVNLRARDGGTVETYMALAVGQWYNIWAVIDQTTDSFDMYVTAGYESAVGLSPINPDPINFRNGTTADLSYFLALTNYRDFNYRLDDIHITLGKNLAIPEPVTMLMMGLGGLMLALRKR
ncbi:MAG TPA: PEP-CTERM sorting domain-containing protein [Anaerohalosphaeraceae bacterium]|nr:PEP-CTERM sorting domain-containing protein [Anaerohalosphaeraceae bacterium]HOL32534.1 PEP-CTERM sorting domain-containing protein [Anaerohalosphaeraceae bacterium]HOM77140.1 PEP-CTERM sorting domain-containing protein [Anaerohalosphaeraceae bacterium]HPC65417.1 PEP-CTERM sorting domain-containing protein [Anaerohalosphaeraceae bacterium]HPO70923.1 PEP-CTERM sorting domain-containing protein [Anaerohalosphaeraceae bacterium]